MSRLAKRIVLILGMVLAMVLGGGGLGVFVSTVIENEDIALVLSMLVGGIWGSIVATTTATAWRNWT